MRRSLSTRLIAAVLLLTTHGCATSYSLTPDVARRAAHGEYAEHEGVPATADDGREVKLRPSALLRDELVAPPAADRVPVHPRKRARRDLGAWLLLPAGLLSAAAIIVGSAASVLDCYRPDGGCFPLGNAGGAVVPAVLGLAGLTFFVTGAVLAASGNPELQ